MKTIQTQLISAVCAVVLLGCPGPMSMNDAGTGGGGGTVTGGGSGGGGGAATGGGGGGAAVLDPCDSATFNAQTGTFTLGAGATIMNASALPAGITQVASVGSSIVGLTSTDQVRQLGSFPTLTAGANIASIRAPGDDAGTIFAGAYLASSGTKVLAGYTKPGMGMTVPGSVALIETSDGGVTYVNAPGNYDATGVENVGFVINGLQLGSLTGSGAYVLKADTASPGPFAAFDAAWNSGFTAATSNGIVLLGYYGTAPRAGNYVRAIPPMSYLPTLQTGGTAFALAPEVLVASVSAAEEVLDLAAAGTNAIIAFGSYDTVTFAPNVRHIDRVPLSLVGSGVQSVTVGTAAPLLSTTDTCTKVLFIQGSGPRVLVGLEDKNGRRLLDLTP